MTWSLEASTDQQFQATGYFRFDLLNAYKLFNIEPHPGLIRGLALKAQPVARPPSATTKPAGKPAGKAPAAPAPPTVPETEQLVCTAISVSGWAIDPCTVHVTGLALPASSAITELRLSHVSITAPLLQRLCEAVAKTAIATVLLDGTELTAEHIDALRPLAKSAVRVLSLRQCNLSAALAIKLAEIWKGSELQYLSLWGNPQLDDGAAKALAELVTASKSLQALSLGRTAITDATVTALCESLSRRALDTAAAAAARKQIEEQKRKKGPQDPLPYEDVGGVLYQLGNRSLVRLDLSETAVGVGAVRALLAVTEVNRVLCEVALEATAAEQSDEGRDALSQLQSVLASRAAPASK